jgi:hypothetical protein
MGTGIEGEVGGLLDPADDEWEDGDTDEVFG